MKKLLGVINVFHAWNGVGHYERTADPEQAESNRRRLLSYYEGTYRTPYRVRVYAKEAVER